MFGPSTPTQCHRRRQGLMTRGNASANTPVQRATATLPQEIDAAPRPGFVCRFCHFQLWCRRQASKDVVALEALPGPAPESWEVTRVVGTLKRSDMPDRVTLDLSRFEIMSSSWLASLVRFKKALQVSGYTLVLSGLRPYICEIFDRMHLETYFEIVRIREQG